MKIIDSTHFVTSEHDSSFVVTTEVVKSYFWWVIFI